MYLVWLRGEKGKVEDGTFKSAQYSRELDAFEPGQLWGLVITHWAKVEAPI